MDVGINSAIRLRNTITTEGSKYLSRVILSAVMTFEVMNNNKYFLLFQQTSFDCHKIYEYYVTKD
jgi:hypothetical protein